MKNKIYQKIKKEILIMVKEMRIGRNAKFMFFPKNLSLKILLSISASEILKKYNTSDQILINETLKDLIGKKILHPLCLTQYSYSLGTFTYHDIYLKTIDNKIFCRGTSTDMSEAFAKALGEVFERTAIKFGNGEELIYKKIEEIKNNKNYFDFNLRAMPTEKQIDKFPNSKIIDSDKFAFIQVEKISDKSSFFIPAQTVFMGGFFRNEKNILQSTTHGAGAGFSELSAFFSSFYEIIHRHYFFKYWYFKKSPNILDLKTLPENCELSKKVLEFEKKNFKIFCLDFSTDAQIPTFITILEKNGGWYCGGSTGNVSLKAIERSIDEAFSTYFWNLQANLSGQNNITEDLVKNLEVDFVSDGLDSSGIKKVLLFGNSSHVANFDKFFIQGEKVDYSAKFDKEKDFIKEENLYKFAKEKFGENIYLHKQQKNYLEEYNYFVTKVYIPNSYYFALDEHLSRPVLNGVQPTFTKVNPFP